jgi:uncharacterized membrane protein YecN with MAPEG domain
MSPLDSLHVSLIFVSICAASLFFWGAWIGPLRGKLGILRGDGGNADLFKRMRIHGNFVENAPLTSLIMVAAELSGLGQLWLWIAFVSFFIGRAYHFVRYDHQDRGFGMALTTAPALGMAIYVLYAVF